MENGKGFFQLLFDFSFTEYLTMKMIKVLYGIGMLCAGLGALLLIVTAFSTAGTLAGIFALVISPIIFLIYLILVRVYLELISVLFTIADNTGEMARQGRK